ncbi:MAG: hypothetical protein A3B38_00005, partial [Candidatus Levybacteria bacterium RIFCSPLOWO2_01_FULL_36_13]
MKKYVFFLILISLTALWPFFKKGFFETHDGEWMIIRFSAFHQTLTSGQFPVRFVDRLNNNYGYPVINFLYPLPFYLSELPKILGFTFVDSVKTVFVISTVFSVVAMFWALSQFFSKYASLAGAIVYLFIPYRFVDLYVRGSLGENVAFAIAPLILGSIFKINKNKKEFLPILSFGIALLIISHNVLAILFIPLFFLLSILLAKKNIAKIIFSFFTGFLISAFFWLPAFYDLQFVKLSQIKVSDISDHLSSFEKLIIPSWGYGQTPQQLNGLSPQFGLASFAVFVAIIFLFLKSKSKDKIVCILIIGYMTIFFLMTNYASLLWKIPLIDIIQFPWRLLSLVVLISALLTAYVVDSTKSKKIVAGLIIAICIISTITYTKPAKFVDREEGFYSTNEDTTTVRDEYLPLWVNQKPQARANNKVEIVGAGEITLSEIKPANYKANINAKNDLTVKVNTVYFPGWEATVDDQKVNIDYLSDSGGLMSIKLPEGNHKVIIKYGKTPVHLFSELISLIALTGT